MKTRPRLCVLCTDEIDPQEFGVYEHFEGFAQKRKDGGHHGVTLRKVLGFAHEDCVRKVKRKIPARQMSMF